jgi:hypothetical protein
MAERNNRVLLTIGLARVEGDTVSYTRASDKSASSSWGDRG